MSRRPVISAPTLIRLLARLTDFEPPESGPTLSDRLSQWLGWTDAIALSSALNGSPPAVPSAPRALAPADASACARLRDDFAASFARDCSLSTGTAGQIRSLANVAANAEFASYRQRYLTQQQSMEHAIGIVRARLRALLATRSPEMARLATIDAVMERALTPRERTLLAAVPGLLERRFERLRDAEHSAISAAHAAGARAGVAAGKWLEAFHRDMQSTLLAELDIRLQPVQGLLAALQPSEHEHDEDEETSR